MAKRFFATILAAAVLVAALSGCGAKPSFTQGRRFYTTQGNTSDVLEVVERSKPETLAPERDRYPIPTGPNKTNLAGATAEEKQAIYDENKRLMSDCEQAIAEGRLKKHPAADGQFGGTLASDAPAVAKRVSVNPPQYARMTGISTGGQFATGLYAPAGEVVTVTVPEALAGKGFTVNVGLWSGDTNVPVGKISNRMPLLSKSFAVTAAETKVGTPFGGAVYFCLNGYTGAPFDITVSGGVECPGYTLGVTTDEEWQRVRNAPGLYAEMKCEGVRLLVPSSAVRDVKDPREIMEFWDKASTLSNKFMGFYDRQITMSYDYYVAAGAAVAFVGAWFCELPLDWAAGAMDIDSMLKSGGWGSLHEFNHHYQGTYKSGGKWGVDSPGEVTNNVLNAATYILYTNIASFRTESGGLTGWNYVADPYTNLSKCMAGDTSLSQYIVLMHAFGVDKFMEFVQSYYGSMGHVKTGEGQTYSEASRNDFALRASRVFGRDMTAYCTEVLKWSLTEDTLSQIAELKLPSFVPLANLYTSGTDGVTTGRPFYIPAGASYTFDFKEKMACPREDYTIRVKGFKHGRLQDLGDGKYVYTPPKNVSKKDDFTLEVTFSDGTRTKLTGTIAQDPNTLVGKRYDDVEAQNLDEAMPLESKKADAKVVSNIAGIPNYNVSSKDKSVKSFAVIEGKIVPAVTGTYSVYLKADDAAKLYFSTKPGDRDSLELRAEVKKYSANYNEKDESTFFTARLIEGEEYYFKLYNYNAGGAGGARLGWKEPVYNAASPDIAPDEDGKGGQSSTVAEEQGKLVDIPNAVLYAVGAKTDGPKKSDFSSPYYYVRPVAVQKQQLLDKSGMTVLSAPAGTDSSKPESLIDGDRGTYYHTIWSGKNVPPFPHDYALDLGGKRSFNFVNVFTWRADRDAIGEYEILAGNKPGELKTIASGVSEKGVIRADFPLTEARYLTVRGKSNMLPNNKYTVVSEIEVGTKVGEQTLYAQDSALLSYRGDWRADRSGSFANGGAAAGRGTVSFTFTGTAFSYYAKRGADYGTAEVSVDGGAWRPVDLSGETAYRQLVYAVTDLADRQHTVCIRASRGEINVDFIGITETPPKALGAWWVLISAVLLAVAGGVFLAARAYGKEKKQTD